MRSRRGRDDYQGPLWDSERGAPLGRAGGRFNRPDVLVYADPPYLLSTRKMKKQYRHEMTEGDHVRLLEALVEHRGPVMLSGYESELYDGVLYGWQKYQKQTTAEKGLHRTETLWVNFEAQMRMEG